ncbi:type II toxin-antitoxin system RelE/ParE family toxin [Rhodoplanes roseus]|uniref:Addiction module toxin RelE n=1 Tax=Rhodoplanes roseus TaxID=29409 RepID=A0A327L1L0_9BRAD|nr:type II toxin-antitoxin system RelE/ParE family toxin [Rhodoplanes roseus]RAI44267.1 hypothetical protein CH341_10065 [Rhodoplanes roseus]
MAVELCPLGAWYAVGAEQERVFVTKVFARFARRERLADDCLREAVFRAECGSVDADLGGGDIKQRVARAGRGRSGGYRTVIAFRSGQRSVFLYGFAKSERDNIDDKELADLKKLAKLVLGNTDDQLATALREEELKELPGAHQSRDHDR